MPKFTVDTHLFRELGELLVGRDSTALIELVKNSYDADATEVIVHGENLSDKDHAQIVVTDNGNGMDPKEFENGFLRIASRIKEEGERRSRRFHRRYTGAKGVGRLAAHKLARTLSVDSVPLENDRECIFASIDWNKVEACGTLDRVTNSDAIVLNPTARKPESKPGTVITLTPLRREWTPTERTRFFQEIAAFQPPKLLLMSSKSLIGGEDLLGDITPIDVTSTNAAATKFNCQLTGDLDVGEDYWQAVGETADWVIEVDARKNRKDVRYAIFPTKRVREELEEKGTSVRKRDAMRPHPNPRRGPFFQARVLVREGSGGIGKRARAWVGSQSGVRVFMEGFRVLPYGEPSDDWLSIDGDYVKRDRVLRFLESVTGAPKGDEDEGLLRLRKGSYFGAIFLTQNGSTGLQMLVNREGFVPNQAFEDLVALVRTGIDLSVRVRAAVRAPLREQRSELRKEAKSPTRLELKAAVEQAVQHARFLAREARSRAVEGDYQAASDLIIEAAAQFQEGAETSERLVTERETVQILASLGLHMSGFVHEVRGLLGMVTAIEQQLEQLRISPTLSSEARRKLGALGASVGELRRVVERQAANLTEVTAPDARRRRSRQNLSERFDAACRLLSPRSERLGIRVENRIPAELKSPPMFPAELMLLFANLLSNAIKAAGEGGRIAASGALVPEGSSIFRLENTGVAVDLDEADRWFLPFESTTANPDPALGQGMGLGLTITRHLLEEYGASIGFVRPSRGFATAIEIRFAG